MRILQCLTGFFMLKYLPLSVLIGRSQSLPSRKWRRGVMPALRAVSSVAPTLIGVAGPGFPEQVNST